MPTANDTWTTIADAQVRHVWHSKDAALNETVYVSPDWYEENGTPIDSAGEDMTYSHTEIAI